MVCKLVAAMKSKTDAFYRASNRASKHYFLTRIKCNEQLLSFEKHGTMYRCVELLVGMDGNDVF